MSPVLQRFHCWKNHVSAGLLLLALGALTACTQHPRVVVRPPLPPPVAPKPPAQRVGRWTEHVAPKPALPAVTTDPKIALVQQCEADYAQGVNLYNSGHLDDARHAFNSAINRLLTSQYSVRDSPLLQHEFDSLVDRIHALEVEALRAGDGFTEQRLQPAPIDSVAQLTFPITAAMRAQVLSQIKDTKGDLPLELTDPVIRYIHFFSTSGRKYLENSFQRAGLYRPMIQRVLKQEGLPQDLIYLAMAESSFYPHSLSRTGALGIWQFMPGEAADYHLKRDWWIDEREDPVKSTVAAAEFLKYLHRQFGDWYLAMAAYDGGPGTVQRAVAETGYADFWELYKRGVLPQETRNYVPIILAMALIGKNPQQYGLNNLRLDEPLRFDTVRLDSPLDLRLAAECANTTVEQLQELNPSLLRLTTPNEPGFELHLPVGSAERFEAAIQHIPAAKRVLWRYHRVRGGETLTEIARHYHSTASSIREVNNLREDETLRDGQDLVIPINHEPEIRSTRLVRYRVRRGDTLFRVARRFHVTERQLRLWNHLRFNRLRTGHYLYIRIVRVERAPLRRRRYTRRHAARRRRYTRHPVHARRRVVHRARVRHPKPKRHLRVRRSRRAHTHHKRKS